MILDSQSETRQIELRPRKDAYEQQYAACFDHLPCNKHLKNAVGCTPDLGNGSVVDSDSASYGPRFSFNVVLERSNRPQCLSNSSQMIGSVSQDGERAPDFVFPVPSFDIFQCG